MNKRILIVDDEPDIVVIMKFTLERNGFIVITAYDGEDGLKKAKDCKPDLIILDVLMPKIMGDDVAMQLQKDPWVKNTPIIFLTNIPSDYLSTDDRMKKTIISGGEHQIYLPKSCSEEDLLSAIHQALPDVA